LKAVKGSSGPGRGLEESSRGNLFLTGGLRSFPFLADIHRIYNRHMLFQWDGNNLRKIRMHRITQEESELALQNDPVPIYEQDVEGENRFLYFGETNAGRLLAIVVTERDEMLRVVTAYDLDAGQRREYLRRRMEGH
jgi:uncharacterized DUF497 family protein